MAMIVETGAGVAGANSYTTVAFIQAYFDDRGGNTAWDALATDADREFILIKATDYIEKRFSEKWLGDKNDNTNELSWPRHNVYDRHFRLLYTNTEIPPELQKAVGEYAVRAITAALIADPSTQGLEVEEVEKKIGPIEKREKFMKGGGLRQRSSLVRDSVFKEYPAADLLLEKFLAPTNSKRMTRI
jgi:hypothetical protein